MTTMDPSDATGGTVRQLEKSARGGAISAFENHPTADEADQERDHAGDGGYPRQVYDKNGTAEDLDDLQGPGDRRCPAGWVEAAALAMA